MPCAASRRCPSRISAPPMPSRCQSGRHRDGRKARDVVDARLVVDDELRKCRVTVDASAVLGDERQREIVVAAQPLDEIGFGGARKRRTENVPDRSGVLRALRPDNHDSRVPGAIFAPRRNSSAFIGCLPARWTSSEPHRPVTARDGQPIVQHRAGRARALAARRAQHLDRADRQARTTRRETATARGNGRAPPSRACAQSMRVSPLSILAA